MTSQDSGVLTGHWIWDENEGGLIFISNVTAFNPNKTLHTTVQDVKVFAGCTHTDLDIKFYDPSTLQQIRFRRHYQRRVKPNEPDVVILQDIKDVVIFQALKRLPKEFINWFHTQGMDRFLRVLIIYFQYFIQMYDEVMVTQKKLHKMLSHPSTRRREDKICNNLADLRSMVACEYGSLILGAMDNAPYHHMANEMHKSSTERDTRLWELLYRMAVRIVWIALQRRSHGLIELELNRMFRSNPFNVVLHRKQRGSSQLWTTDEARVLCGKNTECNSKFLHRSPVVLDILRRQPDFRLLGIGCLDFKKSDDRTKLLEQAFTLPEEKLQENGVTVGILGLPRNDFDSMLIQISAKEKDDSELISTSTTVKNTANIPKEYTEFVLPDPVQKVSVPSVFPRTQIHYENPNAGEIEIAKTLWKTYNPSHR